MQELPSGQCLSVYDVCHSVSGGQLGLQSARSPSIASLAYSEVYNPPYISSSLYMYMEEDLCKGVVYFTVMFDHPSCFLTFAVLVSLHPATFLMIFITL